MEEWAVWCGVSVQLSATPIKNFAMSVWCVVSVAARGTEGVPVCKMNGPINVGRLSIDNNAAGRGMRSIAVGRKNFLFMGSDTDVPSTNAPTSVS